MNTINNISEVILSKEQKELIMRGVSTVDRVVNEIVLPYSIMGNNKVMLSFARIFAHRDEDLVSHYLDKFIVNNDKDWGRYSLSCDLDMIREFFNYFDIPIEPDKYNDETELFLAQLDGKNKFDIFPFEYEIIRRFYLYGNNHSLDSLDKRFGFVGVDKELDEEKVSRYGNGINWSRAWNCFSDLAKESFVWYLIDTEK
jgi:hypothetical protein